MLANSITVVRIHAGVAAEKDLAHVDARGWELPSPCAGWTVHDVVAHLVDGARTTRPGFLAGLAAAGFDFDRLNARGVARERGASPRDTLDRLRRVAARTSGPPRLVEEVVHGEDVRRPLGIARSYPLKAVVRALRLQVRTPVSFGGAKEPAAGVRLVAVDADAPIGEGPEVAGTALALLLAVCGRPVADDELHGPGRATLVRVS